MLGGEVRTRSKERLSARFVATIRQPGYYADGGGLYLQVSKVGSKSWIFRYTLSKPREMGLGALAVVSLKMARDRAGVARELVANNIDPIEHRDTERAKGVAARSGRKTFRECAEAYIDEREFGESGRKKWRNAKHASQWRNTLGTYAYPVIGDLPVSDIDEDHVLSILRPLWAVKTETASRVRGRIERVLDWAAGPGRRYRKGDNPARWRGHLEHEFDKPSDVQKVVHHTALPFVKLPNFITQLRARQEYTALALEFVILTAVRVSEAIKAKWTEFDLEAPSPLWTIPASRMKSEREHRVPLAPRAVEILHQLQPIKNGAGDVFPSPLKPNQPLSDAGLLSLAKRLGGDDLTVHGFRSSFRDWTSEATNYPRDVAEMALAHVIENKAEAAYRRGDLLEKRRKMMEEWARFCGGPRAKVIDLPKRSQRRAITA